MCVGTQNLVDEPGRLGIHNPKPNGSTPVERIVRIRGRAEGFTSEVTGIPELGQAFVVAPGPENVREPCVVDRIARERASASASTGSSGGTG